MRYTLGVDIGSSGLKLSFLGEDARAVGPFGAEIQTHFPNPGWAEQNPDDWYTAFQAVLKAALKRSGIAPDDIVGIACDAATHTTVLLDANMRPVRNAIMWNDQRSTPQAGEIEARYGRMVLEKTFHAPGAMWSLCQIKWVMDNEPELWRRTERLLFAKDYLRYRMGGGYVTDSIDAQGSQMFNLGTMAWDQGLLDIIGLPMGKLPGVLAPTDVAGEISDTCARETGLKAGTKIYAGASDTAMEILAAGATRKGDGTIKLATSGRICVITDRAYPHEALVNYSHAVPGLWYPGTGTRSCATSMRWFKDQFCKLESAEAQASGMSVYERISAEAQDVPIGSEGLFYHPYLLGESTPCRNPYLRASFVGASMKHTHAHFARSVMEGCAYSLYDCFETLQTIGVPVPMSWRLIGGGSVSPVWASIVADLFDQALTKPAISDSSYGSAMLAAVGAGIFTDFLEAARVCCRVGESIEPNRENGKIYRDYFGLYKEFRVALEPLYNRLAPMVSNTDKMTRRTT